MAVYSAHQRPHVSAAIRQLRGWVTLCAIVLAVSAGAQALVYAFVQFTDVRYVEVRQVRTDAPLRVVTPGDEHGGGTGGEFAGGVRATVPETSSKTVRILSGTNAWLERTSALACAAGVMSAVMLAVLTLLGVAVAGGACVPGVERVVTAGVWSLVLALLCLPWASIAPGVGVPGILVGYEAMTEVVDKGFLAGRTMGTLAGIAQWVVAPMVTMFAALGICLWFRAGVERGVIATSPSEFDRAVEREVEMIAKRGVASGAPKALGALNR
ncbi:MAG: hypothetical protein K2Q20_01170, partial [Phycisphaerales bacterium]|nr:hypothetical protein [Phycisphaerales bacterium]